MNTISKSAPSISSPPAYDHTQTSPLPWVVLPPALLVLAIVYGSSPGSVAAGFAATIALVMGIMFCLQSLRITDEGNGLLLRFGPLPLVRKQFRYAKIAAAEPDRSSVIDGWGIHFLTGRGWTYNVWGRDCVRLTMRDGQTVRLGTDDAERLSEFVQGKVSSSLAEGV